MSEADAPGLVIRAAAENDVPLVLALIKELAEYEQMANQVVATEADVHRALFGAPPYAEAVIAAKPTHILIPEKGAASIGGVDGVVELAGVGQTPAGADKRVVLVDDLTLLGFGPRMGEALEAMQDGLGIPDKDADIEAKK